MKRPDNLLTIKKIGDEHDLALADICDYALALEARLKGAEEAAYDVFAYRLGPDEWEEAQKEFKEALKGLGKEKP